MSEPDHEPNGAARKGRGRWTAIALAVVGGLALGGGAFALRTGLGGGGESAAPAQPAIGGAFQLTDQDGRAVNEQLLRGKWTAVFFGYTSCPDYCPATLQTLQGAAAELGPRADELQVLLVTVDPARDTPAALKTYLEGYEFSGGVRGLTGTPEQIAAAEKAWRVYARPSPTMPGMFDHFTGVYLMDPQGRFDTVLSHGLGPQEAARQIRAAMGA